MPAKRQTKIKTNRPEDIVQGFAKYGYTVKGGVNFKRGAHGKIPVYNEVENKNELMTYSELMSRARSGKIKPIDPFLHTVLYSSQPFYGDGSSEERKFAAVIEMPEFVEESAAVQLSAFKTRDAIMEAISQNLSFTINSSGEPEEDKGRLYGFIYGLYRVSEQVFLRHRIVVVITDKTDHIDHYYEISDRTIEHLRFIIRSIMHPEESGDHFNESEDAVQQMGDKEKRKMNLLEAPAQIGEDGRTAHVAQMFPRRTRRHLTFNEEAKEAAQKILRDEGGYWKWINLSGIDLTRFGIYNEFNQSNYQHNCLIQALRASELFEEKDLAHVEECMNVRLFPTDNLDKICEMLNTKIVVKKWYSREGRNRIDLRGKYGQELETDKEVTLLLRDEHFMFMDVVPVNDEIRQLWESVRGKEFKEDTIRLNILLNLLFETKKFKKMSAKQMYLTAIVDKPVSDILF